MLIRFVSILTVTLTLIFLVGIIDAKELAEHPGGVTTSLPSIPLKVKSAQHKLKQVAGAKVVFDFKPGEPMPVGIRKIALVPPQGIDGAREIAQWFIRQHGDLFLLDKNNRLAFSGIESSKYSIQLTFQQHFCQLPVWQSNLHIKMNHQKVVQQAFSSLKAPNSQCPDKKNWISQMAAYKIALKASFKDDAPLLLKKWGKGKMYFLATKPEIIPVYHIILPALNSITHIDYLVDARDGKIVMNRDRARY